MKTFDWIQVFIFIILIALSIRNEHLLKLKQIKNTKNKKGKRENSAIELNSQVHISKRTSWIILSCIFFIGIAVRVWKFGTVPIGINQDEAMGAVDAFALSKYGTDRFGTWLPAHFTAWGYSQMSVLLAYLQAPFIKLFGLNIITTRLPMLLAGLISLWVMFKLSEKIFGQVSALVITAFLAINPWQIMQCRWAMDCNMFPHFFLLGVYFLLLGAENRKYLYMSMVVFALSMYSYGISIYSIPLFLIAVCIYLLIKKHVSWKETFICIGIYLIIAAPIIITIIINALKLPTIYTPFVTMPFFKDSIRSGDILFFSKHPLPQLGKNLLSFLNVIILQKHDWIWNSIDGYGPVYLSTLPFMAFGLWKCIKLTHNKKDKTTSLGVFLIIVSVCMGVIIGAITDASNANRLGVIFYWFIILAGYGITQTIMNVKWSKWIIGGIYCFLFLSFSFNYLSSDYKQASEGYFFNGFGQAIEYVDETECDKIYLTGPAESILAMFYDKTDAKYFQGKREIYSKNGKKLLPYNQRFNIITLKDTKLNPNENAAYIINKSDKNLINQYQFKITDFENYCVVLPKNN